MNEYYLKIGMPLKQWIRNKYGSQKICCRVLGIKPSYLSMIIKGNRKANRETIQNLRNSGFNADLFYNYIKVNDLHNDNLTLDEVRFIVGELKELICQKDIIIESLEMEIRNYRNDIIYLREKIRNSVKPKNTPYSEISLRF